MLMIPTLAAFMRTYPEIMLDLDFSDRIIDVIEEGFDAVVRFADAGDTRLMSRALGTYRRRLVAARLISRPKVFPKPPMTSRLMPVCTTGFRPAEGRAMALAA